MNRKITVICLAICFIIINISMVTAHNSKHLFVNDKETEQKVTYDFSDDYGIQWEMNFGSDWRYGARYEGPQPIGDCDNDGKNELLIGGRDKRLRIFEWDETKQTYLEMHTIHCPYYPIVNMDADGFAIGDLTGDGENEIAVSWYATIHKWIDGKYEILGFSTWLEDNGGGSPDCNIGDCDNDGKNEFILSCRRWGRSVPEIVVFEWNGMQLLKEAEWDDPGVDGSVYMAGIGDVDYDDENEIVCGSANKIVVLDWNKDSKEFEATIIKQTQTWEGYPFACIIKDSDMDGKNEIHVGYYSPEITIFEWNGVNYEIKFEKYWPDEGILIESLDVGDVDDDGIPEVCAGTNLIHILQWNGTTYVEEAVLPTFGDLAVLNIGDCDNDGKNEIHAGSVIVEDGQDFMSWVYKYNLKPRDNVQNNKQFQIKTDPTIATGNLEVIVKNARVGIPLNDASIAVWNLETKVWYDIQSDYTKFGSYVRNHLPTGEYLLRATMEEYKIQETTIDIMEGQKTSYTFSLQPHSISKSITIHCISTPIFLQLLENLLDRIPLIEQLFQLPISNKILNIW